MYLSLSSFCWQCLLRINCQKGHMCVQQLCSALKTLKSKVSHTDSLTSEILIDKVTHCGVGPKILTFWQRRRCDVNIESMPIYVLSGPNVFSVFYWAIWNTRNTFCFVALLSMSSDNIIFTQSGQPSKGTKRPTVECLNKMTRVAHTAIVKNHHRNGESYPVHVYVCLAEF